jgi:hypothetical protein
VLIGVLARAPALEEAAILPVNCVSDEGKAGRGMFLSGRRSRKIYALLPEAGLAWSMMFKMSVSNQKTSHLSVLACTGHTSIRNVDPCREFQF